MITMNLLKQNYFSISFCFARPNKRQSEFTYTTMLFSTFSSFAAHNILYKKQKRVRQQEVVLKNPIGEYHFEIQIQASCTLFVTIPLPFDKILTFR